jgi:hypothetical protein
MANALARFGVVHFMVEGGKKGMQTPAIIGVSMLFNYGNEIVVAPRAAR